MRINDEKPVAPRATAETPAAPQPAAAKNQVRAPAGDQFAGQTTTAATKPVGEGLPDAAYDGMFTGKTADGKFATFDPRTTRMEDVPGVGPEAPPKGKEPTGKTVLHVNGIWTTRQQMNDEMQAIANATGSKVVGIYNATAGFNGVKESAGDLVQAILDKNRVGSNKAVDTLTNVLYEKVSAGEPIHIEGYSQGALIVSRALQNVNDRLDREDGVRFDIRGTARQSREEKMSVISVETFGGAASHYPDGPQYVHYINKDDRVPTFAGLGRQGADTIGLTNGGRGAKYVEFNDPGDPRLGEWFGPHDIATYMRARIPFEQARAQ